jgi:hypothetical protein
MTYNNIFLGTRKSDNVRITLSSPSWDCSWYWGFGYLGNSREHYHLESYQNGRNISMYDALMKDYNLNPTIKKNLWVFCELVLSAYTLKDMAGLAHRGGSHMTTNPCKELLQDTALEDRINTVLLPAIFQKIEMLFGNVE